MMFRVAGAWLSLPLDQIYRAGLFSLIFQITN